MANRPKQGQNSPYGRSSINIGGILGAMGGVEGGGIVEDPSALVETTADGSEFSPAENVNKVVMKPASGFKNFMSGGKASAAANQINTQQILDRIQLNQALEQKAQLDALALKAKQDEYEREISNLGVGLNAGGITADPRYVVAAPRYWGPNVFNEGGIPQSPYLSSVIPQKTQAGLESVRAGTRNVDAVTRRNESTLPIDLRKAEQDYAHTQAMNPSTESSAATAANLAAAMSPVTLEGAKGINNAREVETRRLENTPVILPDGRSGMVTKQGMKIIENPAPRMGGFDKDGMPISVRDPIYDTGTFIYEGIPMKRDNPPIDKKPFGSGVGATGDWNDKSADEEEITPPISGPQGTDIWNKPSAYDQWKGVPFIGDVMDIWKKPFYKPRQW